MQSLLCHAARCPAGFVTGKLRLSAISCRRFYSSTCSHISYSWLGKPPAQWQNSPCRSVTAAATGRGKDDLLKGIDPDYREDVTRILDLADQAQATWTTVFTDFYAPPVVAAALIVLRKLADVTALPVGGYPQAERCRLCLGNADALESMAADPSQLGGVSALEVSGNFMFDTITHRDVLGACCTGTGVVRGKLGDIHILGEQGAQILVVPDLVEHFEMFLTQIRSVPCVTRAIDLSELKVRPPKVQELRSVEASMRLDSVASAGFRVSRSQMSELCSKGDVRVNWKPLKGSRDVQAGDLISCAGKGRLEIKSVTMTKKGKYAIEMTILQQAYPSGYLNRGDYSSRAWAFGPYGPWRRPMEYDKNHLVVS